MHMLDTYRALGIAAVRLGLIVTYSTQWKIGHDNYLLDYKKPIVYQEQLLNDRAECWSAQYNDLNQFIQVASPGKLDFTGFTIQGRGDYDQWVTELQVSYTLNGLDWYMAENSKIYNGNYDRNTHVTHKFNRPIRARAIRLIPRAWHGHISMRFEVYYREQPQATKKECDNSWF